jgi:hypothetical protein
MLHYVTFVEPFGVEPFGVLPTEAVSFDDAKFASNYTNKVFQSKKKTMSFVSDNISLTPVLCIKKIMKFNSKSCT